MGYFFQLFFASPLARLAITHHGISMNSTSNAAEIFANSFNHGDGGRAVDSDGVTLEEAAIAAGATRSVVGEFSVYTWDDGSRVAEVNGHWDTAYTGCECTCWTGAGHAEGCPEEAAA